VTDFILGFAIRIGSLPIRSVDAMVE
jgi:hypothetical protein